MQHVFRITEQGIQPALRDVRRALLDADVNIVVADTLIEGVKKRSIGQEVISGVTADQQFIKAMYDELLDIMGGTAGSTTAAAPAATLAVGTTGRPAVIVLAGLQGAGKTTAAAKLALYLKEREVDYDAVAAMDPEEASRMVTSRMPKRQRKVLLVAADVYRPAAIQQLQLLGQKINVEVFTLGTDADPVDIATQAVQKAEAEGFDTVIIDTAGRQVIDVDLMSELQRIQKAGKEIQEGRVNTHRLSITQFAMFLSVTVQADETLLVVDAMTGQEAASLTAAFDAAVGISGAILTKLDGDSRGGAAVSVRGVSGKPIKFVGIGERPIDFDPFFPERMASRILGMGDVVSLVEKAAAEVSDADAMKMQQKMLDASFDFDDFLQQSKLVASMGNLAGVAKMMPGVSGMLDSKKIKEVEQRLKKNEAMIFSMTKKERSNPDLLIAHPSARSRLIRITKGSGCRLEEGMMFMSEFQKMRTMMSRMQKQMGGGSMDDPAMSEAEAMSAAQSAAGNRAQRRATKKKQKSGRGGGGGFG